VRGFFYARFATILSDTPTPEESMAAHVLFRSGKHLTVGELTESGPDGKLYVEARYRIDRRGNFLPLRSEILTVHECCIVNENFEVPAQSIVEAESAPYAQVIHESLMPLVQNFRRLDLQTSSLVAYERSRRGLGFLDESKEVQWLPLNQAMSHPELAQRLALEAHKPTLYGLGLWDKSRPEGMYEQSHLRETPLHVYMKDGPFRDVSLIREGTDVWITGYHKGCVIIEADSEEFWRPLEESHYIPSKKDDHYYFTLDADRNEIPDPLDFLPSKPALGTYPGSSDSEDNWNANPDLPRVAGDFRAVPWIPNDDYAVFDWDEDSEKPEDLAEDIAQGADIDKILRKLAK
jgi:hypothetical protein